MADRSHEPELYDGNDRESPEPPEGPWTTLKWLKSELQRRRQPTLWFLLFIYLVLLWGAAELLERTKTIHEFIHSLLASFFVEAPGSELIGWAVPVVILIGGLLFAFATHFFWSLATGARLQADPELQARCLSAEAAASKLQASNLSLHRVVDQMMNAATMIRRQSLPPDDHGKGKTTELFAICYKIDRNFNATVIRRLRLKAGDKPLHFVEVSISASEEAYPAETFFDIDYELACPDKGAGAVYLATVNDARRKAACIYFLPVVPPGQSRNLEIRYRWPGLMRELPASGSEDFSFDLKSAEPIREFQVEVYLEGGSGGTLECHEAGVRLDGMTLHRKQSDELWHGWEYSARNIQPSALTDEIALKVEWIKS